MIENKRLVSLQLLVVTSCELRIGTWLVRLLGVGSTLWTGRSGMASEKIRKLLFPDLVKQALRTGTPGQTWVLWNKALVKIGEEDFQVDLFLVEPFRKIVDFVNRVRLTTVVFEQ